MMIDQGIKFLGILIQHTSLSLTRLDLTERGESVNARSCGFEWGDLLPPTSFGDLVSHGLESRERSMSHHSQGEGEMNEYSLLRRSVGDERHPKVEVRWL